ncbi:MAG TPA: hypothetical protein VIY48_08190 [Candidatus Paceibacterota bacterium]
MEFLYGNIIATLPEKLVPRELWPEYDRKSVVLRFCNPEYVGINPVGVRWSLWPLCFEAYISDTEPDMQQSDLSHTARNRVVMWNQISRSRAVPGWYRLSKRPATIEGYAVVEPEYWLRWSESARRARKKWLTSYANNKYRIRLGSFAEFEKAYNKSTVARSTLRESIRVTRQLEEHSPAIMRYLLVERISNGEIKAGLSLVESDSTKNTYYAAGFYHKDVEDEPLMVALMDEWFKSSLDRGYLFLHFGQFWHTGESRSWKGFSTFKSKFGLFYYAFPPTMWRFARGKLY